MARAVIRFELDSDGVKEFLQSQPVEDEMERQAVAMAGRAHGFSTVDGAKFEVRTRVGFDRAHAYVYTSNVEARISEARDRSLKRAYGGGAK